ncbi:prepilin-type N-terminal cleavage/methylation domain-containing protein [Variovorax sp. J31P207]|uniref:type IV pilus modification PilV family protein n=1 Tax=Variovorax sp. J31P207 TaxID=3053510 RepID=UPI00257506CF|nr:prepilin-type N-terminal cleavage/methylation domain-containing protein [Variovorax sp. J31P207]MDM0065659.1 prepilin-type N-terminal cleavage/methylation domain-containing protein [Variovorax sp. J31P207]
MHAPQRFQRTARPAPQLPRQRGAGRRSERGIALIEVLVALLIFMLGVLGLVGLQTSMTRAQTESKIRADAAYLASEAVGRMWSDLTNLASYNGTSCASLDRCKEWQGKVASGLPGGKGAITVDVPTGDVSIEIDWTLPSGETHKYVTSTTVTKAGK